MEEILIYAFLATGIVVMVSFFLFKIETAVLLVFAVGLSLQYLYLLKLGPVNAFEIAGVGVPFLLMCGLLINGRSIFYEFNKDKFIKYYFSLLIALLFTGVIFTGMLYPLHTDLPLIQRLSGWFKSTTGFIILLITSAFITDEKSINRLLNCIVISMVIPGSIFAWQIATGGTILSLRTGYSFANAFFHHPGVIAYYLLFCVPAALFKYSQSHNTKEKSFWSLVLLILLILIYFTYRRGVWIGLFAQLFTYFFLMQRFRYKLIYGYVLIMIFISLSFTQVTSTFEDRLSDISTFYNNLPATLETNNYDYLFSGRWGFFKANSRYLVSQPLINFVLGNGIGSTYFASGEMGEEGGGHNIYLILLIEYGFLCFCAYLFFLFVLFSKLLNPPATSDQFIHQYLRALISLLVSYVVIGMITHVMYQVNSNWIFWGSIGAYLGMVHNHGRYPQSQNHLQERS